VSTETALPIVISEPLLEPPVKEAVEHLLKSVSSALEQDRQRAWDHMHRAACLLKLDRSQLPSLAWAPDAATVLPEFVTGGLPRWQIRRLIDYIDAHLEIRPLRTSDLASLIGYSHSHFHRAFRRSLGESPRTFVMQRRVAKAQQLMRDRALPLCQIAIDCGFADQSHFSRVFSRLAGQNPGAWRRNHATAAMAENRFGAPGRGTAAMSE
jgi:AraC family transcriptional regulator